MLAFTVYRTRGPVICILHTPLIKTLILCVWSSSKQESFQGQNSCEYVQELACQWKSMKVAHYVHHKCLTEPPIRHALQWIHMQRFQGGGPEQHSEHQTVIQYPRCLSIPSTTDGVNKRQGLTNVVSVLGLMLCYLRCMVLINIPVHGHELMEYRGSRTSLVSSSCLSIPFSQQLML